MRTRGFFRAIALIGICVQALAGMVPGDTTAKAVVRPDRDLFSSRPGIAISPVAPVFQTDGQEIEGTRNVSCQQALKIVQEHRRDQDFVILDFRTEDMYVGSHIPGAICHDVFSTDIDDWLKALDKRKVYLIYCTAGHRSGIALTKMKDMGFVNVLHMHEGLRQWISLGYETVSGKDISHTPDPPDGQNVRALWEAYLAWARTAKGGASPRDYAASLDKEGVPAAEISRRLQVLRGQFTEQPEGIEMIYDPLYGKPLTGELDKDGFKTAPNAFLVEAMKEIKPGGKALDVGAGMGRNAIHLAKLGWDVTGIDLSAQGLAVMRSSAEKAGLKVQTVKTSYADYDFGKERWDLVAMILSWAPVEDPAFLSRLKDSVRPGGHVVFEHVLQRPENPFPPGVHALAPGTLREFFRDFEILTYREADDYGDWGGPPTPHVRMVARKRPSPI